MMKITITDILRTPNGFICHSVNNLSAEDIKKIKDLMSENNMIVNDVKCENILRIVLNFDSTKYTDAFSYLENKIGPNFLIIIVRILNEL